MTATVETLIHAYIDKWNQHDVDALLGCFDPECYYEDTAFAVQCRGVVQMREFCSNSFRTFPNLRFEIGTVFSSAEGAGWDWSMSGNYRSEIKELRVLATGQAILVKGASVTRIRQGLITHNVDYYDSCKLLQQLGAHSL